MDEQRGVKLRDARYRLIDNHIVSYRGQWDLVAGLQLFGITIASGAGEQRTFPFSSLLRKLQGGSNES